MICGKDIRNRLLPACSLLKLSSKFHYMNRRKFIISSSITAVSLATAGFIIKKTDGSFAGDCETTNDILGPKYRPNAPVRSDLSFPGMNGTRLIIKGKIFTQDCKTVLPGTMIELWHCDINGNYDDDSEKYLYRAKWITGINGDYSFRTIVPGSYLNGSLYRPAHYHFRVTAKGHKELISQVYFKDDPHIARDPWASAPNAKERILEIVNKTPREEAHVLFNIFLDKI